MHTYRRKQAPRVVGHPLVRALYEEMHKQKVTDADMVERTGINKNTFKDWRTRTVPRVHDIEACFNVLGLTLKPAKIKEEKHE